MNTHCIYRIVNFRDGKMYVGKTVSVNTRQRTHFGMLKQGKHYNKYLQHAYNKYGREAFYFEVVERDITVDKLNEREIYWIAYFDSFENGYNATPGGEIGEYVGLPCTWDGVKYKTRSEAARALGIPIETLTRRVNLGYTCDADIKGKRGVFTWNGIAYANVKEAARMLGVAPETMYTRRNRGYVCDDDIQENGQSSKIPIILNGIKYKSRAEAARALGISESGLRHRLRKGHTCDFDTDRPALERLEG